MFQDCENGYRYPYKFPSSWQNACNSGIERNLCCIAWTIEDFGFLIQQAGNKILMRSGRSQCCEDPTCKWYIELSTGDQTTEAYLTLKHSTPNITAYTDYTISLKKSNNETFWIQQGNHQFSVDMVHSCRLLTLNEVQNALPNDVLKIHLELMIFLERRHVSLKSREVKFINHSATKTIFEKCNLHWTIQNLSWIEKLPMRTLFSRRFSEGTESEWIWRLQLISEPESEDADSEIVLCLQAEEKPIDVTYCPVQYKIVVKNSSNRIFETFCDKLIFNDCEKVLTIVKGKKLLDHFQDGTLLFDVHILAVTHSLCIREHTQRCHEQNCNLANILSTVFQNEQHCDFNIFVKDKKIAVHKGILIARSPVFHSMLKHNTLEKQESKIEIEDLSYETMMHVWRFMYTNKLTADDDESVIKVLKASDKYQINDLKEVCEEYLILNLNTSNVKEFLFYAETYLIPHLKVEAIYFINLYMDDDFISMLYNDIPTKTQSALQFSNKRKRRSF